MGDDPLAFLKLAAFLAAFFGPMCVPYAVIVLRERRNAGRPDRNRREA